MLWYGCRIVMALLCFRGAFLNRLEREMIIFFFMTGLCLMIVVCLVSLLHSSFMSSASSSRLGQFLWRWSPLFVRSSACAAGFWKELVYFDALHHVPVGGGEADLAVLFSFFFFSSLFMKREAQYMLYSFVVIVGSAN